MEKNINQLIDDVSNHRNYNNCPKKAIQVKGDKNLNARYRNEYVSLKEIIGSNNQ